MSLDLDKLKRLAEAATPGPWRAGNGRNSATVLAADCAIYINVNRDTAEPVLPETVARWQADSRFIAAAREAVPALIDDRAALAARLAEAERLLRAIIPSGWWNNVKPGAHSITGGIPIELAACVEEYFELPPIHITAPDAGAGRGGEG